MTKEYSSVDRRNFRGAISERRYDDVRAALADGMPPDSLDYLRSGERVPVLFTATQMGDIGLLELLVEAGANVNLRATGVACYEADLGTVLNVAMVERKADVVDWLLNRGANPRMTDSSGRTAAHILLECWEDDAVTAEGAQKIIEILDRLIKAGVPVNQMTHESQTLLHLAAKTCKIPTAVFRYLLNEGADPLLLDQNGWAALHHAVTNHHVEALQAFIDHGVDVNLPTARGETALHKCTSAEIADVLYRAGANLDAQDNDGRTPLARMLRGSLPETFDLVGVPELMARLLAEGANIDAPDFEGVTPRQYVAQHKIHRVETAFAAVEARSVMRRAASQALGGHVQKR